MSDILRGGLNTLGVSNSAGDFKLQLKRPKAKITQNVPELVAKFGEVKRRMLDLARENESLKEQLLKAHTTNGQLAQENTQLKEKASQVLDVEATIDQSIEELLAVDTGAEEPTPVEVSKIPRPVRFGFAKKTVPLPPVAQTKEVRAEPTMKNEMKVKNTNILNVPGTALKKESVPSPFEVVDLTLVKKDEPVILPVPSVKETIAETQDTKVVNPEKETLKKEESPTPFFPAPNILEENKLAEVRKEKIVSSKAKLEAVSDATMEDVSKYIFAISMLPVENQKLAVAKFLNLDIMPKDFTTVKKDSVAKDIVGESVVKLKHLTEPEKARLYGDINISFEDFYMKSLMTDGVACLTSTKILTAENATKIIPQIKNLNAYSVWHDHSDQTIGNLDLGGEQINIRKNISSMILSTIRMGELLGLALAPTESISVLEYFEQSKKSLREHTASL